MVMPFLKGQTLKDVLKSLGQRPDETWLRSVLGPLTEALLVIHAEQCYHRDIAPDNVMLLPDKNRWLLLDFGAARRVIGDMTQALTVILKPGYAPVEQYAEIPGMKQGPWTDVYALASVVHYAITGRTPPPSVGRMLNDTYQPLVQSAAGRYSEPFLAAIDRALAVRPEMRTQTIEQLRQELGLDDFVAPANPTLTLARPPASASSSAPTVLLADMPPTARPRSAAAPAPTPPTAVPAARSSGAMVGVGVGAVVLAALGFGAWKMLGGAPTAPSNAPAPQVAAAPAAATPAPAPVQAPAAPAAPQARFDPQREFDRVLQAQSAGFGVTAAAQQSQLRISRGDQVRFKVTAERDGYLHVVGLSADGSLALLVPNANSTTVRVRRGQTYSFPSKDGFFLTASEPVGTGRMLVIVSAQPRRFDALNPKTEGPIKLLASGDEASALLAKFQGSGSMLAGAAACPGGAATCADEYGAAVMTFETLR
jgi:hypothetical protein